MIGDRANKARVLRYKRAALSMLQRELIREELYEMHNECAELEYTVEEDEKLIDVFDGDTDEVHEFRMMLCDLSAKCERLIETLNNEYVTEHFDDFFVGALGRTHRLVGYDSYEEDYYGLTSYEPEKAQEESGKRLMRLTKEKLIAVAGQCIGVMMCFLDVRHSYGSLKSVFELLRDERAELIGNVKWIEDLYDEMQCNEHNREHERRFDAMAALLPERVWAE